MLTAMLTAQAEDKKVKKNDGFLSVTVGTADALYERSGIKLNVYLIADGDTYGDWKLQYPYKDIKVFTTEKNEDKIAQAKWVDQSMVRIRARIHNGGLKPVQQAVTDANGKADFKNLPRGLYFLDMASGPNYLSYNPSILSIPDERNNTAVRVAAKVTYKPTTPPPTGGFKKGPHEHLETIDEYETALGLGNIQMHVGVCFE
jgi:hypothetical protein